MRTTILTIAISFFFSINISNAQILVRVKPVSPRGKVIKVKRPSSKFAWVDGHWNWNKKNQRYKWVSGKWVKPKQGQVWIVGKWINKSNGFVWKQGYWRKGLA